MATFRIVDSKIVTFSTENACQFRQFHACVNFNVSTNLKPLYTAETNRNKGGMVDGSMARVCNSFTAEI